MSNVTGPNLVTSGLVFNIDTFKYNAFNLGAKTWSTTGLDTNISGTVGGTPSWSTTTGNLSFVNSGDNLSWSASSAFAFGTGDFTVEVWIYPTSFGGYIHMVALPDQNTFALKANTGDGAIYFYSTAFNTYPIAGWTLTLNQWNHVVFKRASSVAYAYLNGELKGSKVGFTNTFTAQTLNIHNGWLTEYVACQMFAVRIYNRALSDAEVNQNYLAFKGRTYEPVSFPALTTTQAIPTKSTPINTTDNGFQPVTASGGYGSLTWGISPTLVTGFSLNTATGIIFGTPSALITNVSYTVTATDAIGQTSSKSFVLTVTPPLLVTSLDTITLSAYSNTAVNNKPVSASGGYGTYSYSISPALPSGLSFNTTTGYVTGTYASTITQNYTITVTDQTTPTAQTSSKTFTLQYSAPPALSTTVNTSTYTFTLGTQITPSTPVSASGGVVPYTYGISPSLPTGISFSTSTGTISGAPSVGSSLTTYTVTATDSALQTSSKTFTLEVLTYSAVIPTTNLYSHWDFSKTTDAAATSYTTSGVAFSGGISGLNFGAVSTTPSLTYLAGSTSYPMTVQQTASGKKYVRFTAAAPAGPGSGTTSGTGSMLRSGGNAFPDTPASTTTYCWIACFRVITSQSGWYRPYRWFINGYSWDYTMAVWYQNGTASNTTGNHEIHPMTYSNSINPYFNGNLAANRDLQGTMYVEAVSITGATSVDYVFRNSTGYTSGTGTIGGTPLYGTQPDANRYLEIRDSIYWNGGAGIEMYEIAFYSSAMTIANMTTACTALYNKWTT